MFFWNSLVFSMIQRMLETWSLIPLPFLKPAWTSGSSQFTYCWGLAWRNFKHYFSSMWDECNCVVVWAFFGIAFLWDVCMLIAQLCLNLCNPMEYSPPGSSVHGIVQARIPQWVAISFSRGASRPRDQTHVSCTAGRFFTICLPSEPPGKPTHIHTHIYVCVSLYI